MNTVLYNVGIFTVILGVLLIFARRQKKAEVEVEGLKIKGREGYILMVLGLLMMASASW